MIILFINSLSIYVFFSFFVESVTTVQKNVQVAKSTDIEPGLFLSLYYDWISKIVAHL